MSLLLKNVCRKCSLCATFLLYFQLAFSQNNFNSVDQWLDNHLNELGGRATLVIFKNGKIIYDKSENNLSPGKKMILKFLAKRQGKNTNDVTEDFSMISQQPIASCSKWLSAALVMTFVDEGKLHLNDTVGKFLPILSRHQKGMITIQDCLSHLTGISSGNFKETGEIISKSNTMDQVIETIAGEPMEGAPGTVFHYSSIGLQIAAAVIEKISHEDFRTLFHERIAVPCGMKNTDWGDGKVPTAAGSARSTPEDYIHFLQMILQNGNISGKEVLSEKSIIAMQQDYTKNVKVAYTPNEAKGMDYGLGEWIMQPGNTRAVTLTSPGLFGSFPWVDNQRQYAGFLFVVNIRNNGRYKNYLELKSIIDEAIDENHL
ncbi:MAG: serine hydrolase domain-containing protein [Ginsengibacter sp.]